MNVFPKLSHIPVLLNPVMEILKSHSIKSVLDCTFGNGGYTRELQKYFNTTSIDRDLDACKLGKSLGFDVEHKNFKDISGRFDAIVYDLGICTNQLSYRGFSYRESSELDMRMDTSQRLSAFEVVNEYHLDELAQILLMGEEVAGYKIAKAIINQRRLSPFKTSGQLSKLVLDVKKMKDYKGFKHPAALTFQAVRMHVNDEIGSLWKSLIMCEKHLKEGGLVLVVTFHSIEDRLVKHFFKSCIEGIKDTRPLSEVVRKDGGRYHRKRLENLKAIHAFDYYGIETPIQKSANPTFKKHHSLIRPTMDEIGQNPRARSAKLRCYQRTSADPIYT